MKNYGIYLFDFDYTLADSSAGIVRSFQNVLARNGYTGVCDDSIKRTIGKTLEDSFSELTGVMDTETLSAYKNEYIVEAKSYMTANTKLFPETKNVLTQLKDRGAKIGIVSTKYRYTIMELINRDFPEGFFDIVVGCEDVAEPKPSPEGVLYALERLGGSMGDTLYIGDSIIDAELARTAGIDFVGVLHGMTTREELAVYPHLAIADDLSVLVGDNEDTGALIIALEKEALKLWNNGDPDGFLELSSEDIVYFDPALENKLEGRKALEEYYNTIRGKIKIEKYEMLRPSVWVTSDIAVLAYDYEVCRDGQVFRMHCTEVYRKEMPDRWKIVHTHWSFVMPAN